MADRLSSFQICMVYIGFYGRLVVFSRFVYRQHQNAKKSVAGAAIMADDYG